MIAGLRGVLAEKTAQDAVIDVSGVAYRVAMSTLSLARLAAVGEPAAVRVVTVVRQDALELYGFLTQAEEEMFRQLTSVTHVGPKVAMNVLSGLEVPDLIEALSRRDAARLTQVHGVGKKLADRLVLELAEKVKALALASPRPSGKAAAASSARTDLVSALLNLGYKQAQADAAADAAAEHLGPKAGLEALLKEALKALRSG